jgi:hypothetical protein
MIAKQENTEKKLEKEVSNPTVFPVHQYYGDNERKGMTMRDYSAISAIQGILASGNAYPTSEMHFYNIVEDGYKIADAILKHREK